MRPLPGPDAPDSAFDLGLVEPVPEDYGTGGPYRPSAAVADETLAAELGGQDDDDGPDEPEEEVRVPTPGPAHAKRSWRRASQRHRERAQARGRGGRRPAPVRVTASIRQDIDAKISFALEIPGRLWQAKDPVCGSAFVEQRPEIAGALTEIVCNSPELVAWFTGAGGGFLLYLNLCAAVWPVATLVLAHHIYHSVGDQYAEDPGAVYGEYAA